MSFSICPYRACFAAFCLVAACCWGQPKSELSPPPPLEPAEGERQGRALVARLLEQHPEQPATNSGVLKTRNADGNWRQSPAQFDLVPTATNWFNVYHALAGSNFPPITLTIVHSDRQPNQYFVLQPGKNECHRLTAKELMAPFAGSDFWIADLGLEFLHWPQQRVLRKQMRKGLFCDVLQSVNPGPTERGYSRVESWIAVNRPEDIVIVHADAYDSHNKLLKEFNPKKVEKVNGVWQLEEMEIRNLQAGTRTIIGFNLDER